MISVSTPDAAAPLAAMWKGMLARVGSAAPELATMASFGTRGTITQSAAAVKSA